MTPPAGALRALRALVAGLVDYAGLFPPAALPMPEAAAGYASYLESPDAWMLGRFVVPAARLDELAEAAARHHASRSAPWRVSALVAELASDVAHVARFGGAGGRPLLVDVVEIRAATSGAIADAARARLRGVTLYLEIPHAAEPRALLTAVRDAGARAKVRTGGVTADAFPTAAQLARFIARCAEVGVPFKATAGLHHPLRAEHPLTYEPDAPRGMMFGFLNVFAAAAFARAGMDEDALAELLEERDPASLRFDDHALRWRGRSVTVEQLADARASFATAFGSCSFREPVDDLHQLALL